MNPERPQARSFERKEQPKESEHVFDFERMTPEQVDTLVTALGIALDNTAVNDEAGVSGRLEDMLESLVVPEVRGIAERNLDQAGKLFAELIQSRSVWSRRLAMDDLGADLLQRLPEGSPEREWLIDQWVAQLHPNADDVDDRHHDLTEAANYSLWETLHAEWLDERTAERLRTALNEAAE